MSRRVPWIDHKLLAVLPPLTQEERDELHAQIQMTYKAWDMLQNSHRAYRQLAARIEEDRMKRANAD